MVGGYNAGAQQRRRSHSAENAQGQGPQDKQRRGNNRKPRGGRRTSAGNASNAERLTLDCLSIPPPTLLAGLKGAMKPFPTEAQGQSIKHGRSCNWGQAAAVQSADVANSRSLRFSGVVRMPGPEHALDLGSAASGALLEDSRGEIKAEWRSIYDVLDEVKSQYDEDKLTDKGRQQVFKAMQSKVKELALDSHGCRVVQQAMELTDDSQQVELVSELKGAVRELLGSAHGNHVLQRCIELLRPSAVIFILDELQSLENPPHQLACDKYGCRVLERLIEHFPREKLHPFLDAVLNETIMLSKDNFGNFVVQHVLEHGTEDQKRRIVEVLKENLEEMAINQCASSVLDKALSYTVFQQELATAILETNGLLPQMALQRPACAATQRLFKVFDGEKLEKAKKQLNSCLSELQATKHGKTLLKEVAPELCAPDENAPPPVRARAQTDNFKSSNRPQERRRHKTSVLAG